MSESGDCTDIGELKQGIARCFKPDQFCLPRQARFITLRRFTRRIARVDSPGTHKLLKRSVTAAVDIQPSHNMVTWFQHLQCRQRSSNPGGKSQTKTTIFKQSKCRFKRFSCRIPDSRIKKFTTTFKIFAFERGGLVNRNGY